MIGRPGAIKPRREKHIPVTSTELRWHLGCSLSLECQRFSEKYMARIPVRLLIFGLLFTSPAVAQSSWLHPSDREYQYAIDSAFGKAEVRRDDAQALEFIQRLPDGTNSYISVRPPLACASLNAEAQRRDLGRAPSVDEVKEA